jgi:Aspartyl protease
MIDKPGRPITVLFSEPLGGVAPSFATCPPVIYVRLAADPHWNPKPGSTPKYDRNAIYRAMIDTGTDDVAIRPAVALAIGAHLMGNGVGHGVGGSISGIKCASVQILMPTINVIFHAPKAAVMDLAGDARSFDLILGRSFLRHCRLCLDGPNEAYSLEWLE